MPRPQIRNVFKQMLMKQGHTQTRIDRAWKRALVHSRVEGFSEQLATIEIVTRDILEDKHSFAKK